MNYLDLTEIRQHLGSLERSPAAEDRGFHFATLTINTFIVAFYAGHSRYCQPSRVLDNLLDYSKIQIRINEMIINPPDKLNAIRPSLDTRFSSFEWIKYFGFIDSKGALRPSYMGLEIPLDDVCLLIRDIYKISRLKMFY